MSQQVKGGNLGGGSLQSKFCMLIHRFLEDKVRKGRMDCMRRWRIQGTVLTSGIAPLFLLQTALQSSIYK